MLERIASCLRSQITKYIGQFDIRSILDTSRKCRIRWKAAIIDANWYGPHTTQLYYEPDTLIRVVSNKYAWKYIMDLCEMGKFDYVNRTLVPVMSSRENLWNLSCNNAFISCQLINHRYTDWLLVLICRFAPNSSIERLIRIVLDQRLTKYFDVITQNFSAVRIADDDIFDAASYMRTAVSMFVDTSIDELSRQGANNIIHVMKFMKKYMDVGVDVFNIYHLADHEKYIIDMYLPAMIPYLNEDPIAFECEHERKNIDYILSIFEAKGIWPLWIKSYREPKKDSHVVRRDSISADELLEMLAGQS